MQSSNKHTESHQIEKRCNRLYVVWGHFTHLFDLGFIVMKKKLFASQLIRGSSPKGGHPFSGRPCCSSNIINVNGVVRVLPWRPPRIFVRASSRKKCSKTYNDFIGFFIYP